MNNKKEFVELIERYETITLDEITKEWTNTPFSYQNGHTVAQGLTGFGGSRSCTLCVAVDEKCYECVYGDPNSPEELFGCLNIKNRTTYNNIDYAESPEELLEAFRKRAEHLKKHYSNIIK